MSKKQASLLPIFMTVFVDLVGFGIILPMTPFLARNYNADGFEIGGLITIYSLMQFLMAPVWGRLSDRYGRKPIIAFSLFGGFVSYIGFAFSTSLLMLYIFRGLSGLCAANISAAHAYISDITTEENRAKGMGLIGAAFGMGFIFGPVIGAGLAIVGESLGSAPPLGIQFPALGAALLSLINGLWVVFFLPESLKNKGQGKKKPPIWKSVYRVLSLPVLNVLVLVFFMSGLSMSLMEAMFFPFLQDRFGWGLKLASLCFAFVGVMMAFTQGYLIRKLVPKYGESKVLVVGLILMAISMVLLGFSMNILMLGLASLLLALGNGCMRPPLMGLISMKASSEDQGLVMGVAQSLGAVGRIVGPLIAGIAYDQIGQSAPFVLAGVAAIIGLLLIVQNYEKLPKVKRSQ